MRSRVAAPAAVRRGARLVASGAPPARSELSFRYAILLSLWQRSVAFQVNAYLLKALTRVNDHSPEEEPSDGSDVCGDRVGLGDRRGDRADAGRRRGAGHRLRSARRR